MQAAAATTGTPPIAIQGADGTVANYGPGTVLHTGEGSATILDPSKSLDALIKLQEALLQRLAVNSRTPESLLGRVKPNEVPSGIALTLSFTPHSGMINKMRLVRDYKYRLLLKFVLRLAKANGVKDLPEEEFETRLRFGSYLPSDLQEAMTIITQLLEAKAISLETAVQFLLDKGYPIKDVTEEIKNITKRDVESAQVVMTITGNPEIAAKMLDIDPKDVAAFDDEEKAEHEDENLDKQLKSKTQKPPAG
jgi:hypothetical protein